MALQILRKQSRKGVAVFLWFWMIQFFGFQPAIYSLTSEDEDLLTLVQQKAFDYFLKETNLKNGLVADRAHNFNQGGTRSAASIAAVGFALSAYPVGVERGWMDRGTAAELTRRTLDFFLKHVPQEHGFFYHFLNIQTGERVKNSELSPIDTALFLAGAFLAAEYFEQPEIRELTQKIYERVDFPWMMHNGKTLAMAWSPESGFSRHRWDHYNESMILYLLAIGSPTFPIPADSWKEINRPVASYKSCRLIQMPPLFTHQYSHLWIDFRDKNDGFADYFKNSVNATLANRAFCMNQSNKFATYGENAWGLTASDGPFGYRAYGAAPGWAIHDGTLAPTGCIGSIMFTPEESLACMKHLYGNFKDKLWGLYGFSDAFNLDKDWFDQEVIAIDQGTILLAIENFRTGFLWNLMSKNETIQKAMTLVGFKPGSIELPWPEPPVYEASYALGGMQIDGFLKDWPSHEVISLSSIHRELGQIDGEGDMKAEIRFAWDEKALYFAAKVQDEAILTRKNGKDIWRDDLLELFIDPKGDGLYWQQPNDFQLGFRSDPSGEAFAWSWFEGEGDPFETRQVFAKSYVNPSEYILEGSIEWSYLNFDPADGKELRLSPAIHDIDQAHNEGKAQWFFRNEDESGRFVLGRLIFKPKPVS